MIDRLSSDWRSNRGLERPRKDETMYIISYLGSDSNWHEQHEALAYDEAIALKAEGERHGDIMRIDRRCEGHPAGPYDTMGETVYCDGTCLP